MRKEKSVLITGASSGLGYALAKKYVAEGYLVIATARRRERLETLVRSCQTNRIFSIVADLNDKKDIESLVNQVLSKVECLDIVINNAGIGKEGKFNDMNFDDMDRMVRINCLAPIYLTRFLLPRMLERGRGKIVIISSTGGITTLKDLALYGATKHFLNGFAKNLHRELKGRGVKVFAFMPGAMNTEFSMVASGTRNGGGEDPEKIASTIYRRVTSRMCRPLSLPTLHSLLTVMFDRLMRILNLR